MNRDNIISGPNSLRPTPEISLGKFLYNSLKAAPPDKALYVDPLSEKYLSYAAFLRLSCRLARSLHNIGCSPTDVISISSENNIYYFLPVVASIYLGSIAAPLYYGYTERELLYLLNIAEPKVVFCSKSSLMQYVKLQDKIKSIEKIILINPDEKVDGFDTIFEFMDKSCDRNFNCHQFSPIDVHTRDHIACLLCSSGTTGMPKEVMLTHDNYLTRISHLLDHRYYSVTPQNIFGVLSFSHAMGFTHTLTAIARKDTVIVLKKFEESTVLRCIEKYKITILGTVPMILNIFSRNSLTMKYDVSSVLEITVGGAPTSVELEERARRIFYKIRRLTQGYGLTEATLAVTQMPMDEIKLGSVGKLLPDMEIKVRDIKSGQYLGPNQPGEICIKGRLLAKGYYRNPDATDDTFSKHSWLYTGDVGYYDNENFVFIIDRLKELIKYKGFQVPPAEIEGVLLSHPKIKDAAVVGKPDNDAGELPTAFVVRHDGASLTEDEIRKFVAGLLSNPKHLRGGVYFVDEIPKTVSNKIKRMELRQVLAKIMSKL